MYILTNTLNSYKWSLPKKKKIAIKHGILEYHLNRLTTTCTYTWKRLSYTYGSFFEIVGKSVGMILQIINCRTEWYKTLVRFFSL